MVGDPKRIALIAADLLSSAREARGGDETNVE